MARARGGESDRPASSAPRHGLLLPLAALLVATLVGGLAALGVPKAGADDGLSGRIVVPRGHELWAVAAAGGADRLLAARPSGAVVLDVAWRGRGGVVFSQLDLPQRADPGGADLYALDSAGQATVLAARDAPGVTLATPALLPDDSLLYTYTPYLGASGDTAARVERLAPGGAPTVVLRGATYPAPTPDGQRFAYVRSTPRGDGLWLAGLDGQGARELVADDRFLGLAYPRVSPDGSQVAFAATIDVPPPDPNGPLEFCARRTPPTWRASALRRTSPLGRLATRCAETARPGAHGLPWDVWLLRLDGGEPRRLTYLLEDEPSLAWAPDGRWLAVQGGSGLTLIEVATGRTERLAPYTAYGAIDWAAE